MHQVILFSRPGCHLCDVAREAIERVQARSPFEFGEVDISGDDRLELEYGIRIPVVTVNGEEIAEIAVDEAVLARAVRA